MFRVDVTDSGGNNTVSDFTITVNSINDEPTANLGTPPHPPTIEEDLGTQTVTNFVTGFDVGDGNTFEQTDESQTFTFTVARTGGLDMFTTAPAIAANGTLTYTPRVNANGTANFSVTMEDSGSGVSPNDNSKLIGNFTITITAKNDAPTLITPPNTVR